ncbi:MAG: hypothetical protein JNK72_03630 [Myxococcales bacterium]|nr:hypothetical protein [Myxococcales bacterium]
MSTRAFVWRCAAVVGAVWLGCSKPNEARIDAGPSAADAAPEAGLRGRRRARRQRPRPGARLAQHAPAAGNPSAEGPSETADEGEEEEAPRPRPRVTETGPMLPENLGPPPAQTLDFGAANGDGPQGLEPAQVRRAMEPLLGRCGACVEATRSDDGRSPRGRVSVRLRVRNDGRPLAAQVSGGGGTAEFVTCVRRVVASARFDRFSGPDVFVTWGFDVD